MKWRRTIQRGHVVCLTLFVPGWLTLWGGVDRIRRKFARELGPESPW